MGMVIVGAGQAGFSVVEGLRKGGYDGAITLVGDEPHPPYQRPPLSKAYLLGEMARERLFLRPKNFYTDHNIDLITGDAVTGIDRATKTLSLQSGGVLPYDKLALTLGATPNRLPTAIGGDLGNVFCVRTLADVDAMEPAFAKGARALIIGGGYIGLEAAAVASKLGVQVTLVEMAKRILQRVAAPQTSDYFRALHQEHGVEILESTGVERLSGDTVLRGARLSNGRGLEVDFAIVGVGVTPNAALAQAAGLAIDNGIAVDTTGATSDPDIFAAGDCASFPLNGAQVRIESVSNAIDMGAVVAEAMRGEAGEYTPKPWFWSDQFDVKLQIAGLNAGYDAVVVRGAGREASHWYYRGETLIAVDAMNDPRAYMIGKRLIEAGRSPSPEQVQGDDLKALLKG